MTTAIRNTAPQCKQQAVQAIYKAAFASTPRSPEWKRGALHGLNLRAGAAVGRTPSPYANGTAQDDAWCAGVQAGLAEGKHQKEKGAL